MKTLIPLLVFCLVATCNAELRTWTAVNGKEVEAEFVSNEKEIVTLKLKSGKLFIVPLNKLSKSDQEFLKAKPSSGPLVDNIVGKVMTFEFEGGEILVQFNGDGRMLAGENGGLEDGGETYKIEGNEVLVFSKGNRDGGISFTSSSPKVGDQVELGPEEKKMKGKIIKIEKITDSKIAGYWVSDVKLTIKNLKALKASSSDDFEKRIYGENIESLEKGVGLEQMPLTLQSKTIIKIEDNGKMIIFMNDSKQVGTYSTKSSSKIIGNLGGRFSMTLDGEALRMMPLGQLDLETGFLPVMFSRTSPPVD